MTAADYSVPDLVDMLRADAHGLYSQEAAAELLIRHAFWLTRSDFRLYIDIHDIDTYDDDRWPALARIDWRAVADALDDGQLPCSSSETAILRIAVSIGGNLPVDLHEALTNLDNRNIALVTAAVRHVGGDRTAWPH